MERVVTVNLNGNSYQLEEPAYAALRAYISSAEAALTGNPDKEEVVRDLEQAIADKCSRFLSPGKTVISTQEMAQVLEEMGPVEGENANGPRAEAGPQDNGQKRLYRIRDGAMLAGICTGLAAYLNIDVVIVRVLAVILGFITGGWLLLAYLIAMFIIPSAQTSEEWASAYGMPFNTQDIIDRAKREYARVSEDVARDFRHSWREQRHAWRKSQQAWRQSWREETTVTPGKPIGYATRVFAGIAAFVLSLIGAALLIAFVVALFGLINVGAIFDWSPPADVPLWLAIVVLCIAYAAVSGPIGFLRRSSYAAASGYAYRGRPSGDFIALLAILAGGALAYQLLPEFRHWIEDLPNSLRALGPALQIL